MNDVAPLVQMMCFAMMWATPNDVALRANSLFSFISKNICKLFMSKTRIVEINSAVLFFIFKKGDQK